MANSGRKPANPRFPGSLFVNVKIPIIQFDAFPSSPKGAIGLNNSRVTTIRPIVPANTGKNKDLLNSEFVRGIINNLRASGIRGIKPHQLFTSIPVICPLCKEIGTPVVEFADRYVKVRDNPNQEPNKELLLFYNHPPNSKHKRCRVCKIENGKFTPFENSKIDMLDLMGGQVLRHILNGDSGYGKHSKIFDVRDNAIV